MATRGQQHKPTDEQRKLAKQLSGVGVPQDDICIILDITKPTLHKYYRRELDLGMAEANAKVAGTLFNQAISGNTAAAIFWSKARMGWRETNHVELTGADGGAIKHEIENPINVLESRLAALAARDGAGEGDPEPDA